MLYVIYTTGRCNLKCVYCGGSLSEEMVSSKIEYSVEDLLKFISKDSNPIIAFYGGEPLLNPKFIMKVMDEIPAKYFVIQSNGTLINELSPEYWLKFDTILLSIDGRREVTNHYRGRGVYEKVLEAAKYLREIGFKKDLIARMTISEKSNIYEDVIHLYSLKLFNHIHWQLNVIWSDAWKDFDHWVTNSYMPGIKRLINLWIKHLKRGELIGLVPFQGIIKSFIHGRIDSPPCGSGINSFTILPSGRIIACPIAIDVNWAALGDIWNTNLKDLVGRRKIGKPCVECDVYKYCGGRCLYTYKERIWRRKEFSKVCRLTKMLIKELVKVYSVTKSLVSKGIINLKDLTYPKYNNTTEIIP